jgi:NADH-quinone oxidoreductase subunit J
MLDVDFAQLRQGMATYLPIGGTIGLILLVELALVVGTWNISPGAMKTVSEPISGMAVTNTEALGRILYTKYAYYFQTAGLVLLVAMIGAIVLTLRHKPNVKRQSIAAQVTRDPADAIEIRKVKTGQGI